MDLLSCLKYALGATSRVLCEDSDSWDLIHGPPNAIGKARVHSCRKAGGKMNRASALRRDAARRLPPVFRGAPSALPRRPRSGVRMWRPTCLALNMKLMVCCSKDDCGGGQAATLE